MRDGRRVHRLVGLGAGILALAVAGLAGCGGTTTTTVTEGAGNSAGSGTAEQELARADEIAGHIDASDVVRVLPPSIVLNGDIAEEKPGSPERAFLEWWQAFQFKDVASFLELTSEATVDQVGADGLEELVQRQGLPGVEILGTNQTGDTAVIEAAELSFSPPGPGQPPPRKPTGSKAVSFQMQREGGDWVFAQTDYLQLKVDNLGP